jgi:hypothetical protein
MFNLLRKIMPIFAVFSISISLIANSFIRHCDSLPVKIYPIGDYFNPAYRMSDNSTMWAISKNEESYNLNRVQVRLGKVQSMIDGSGDTTGSIILSPDTKKTVLLFTGLEDLTPGNITFLDLKETLVNDFGKTITAPRSVEFVFKEDTYKVWAEVQPSDDDKQMDIYIAHKDTKQLLYSYKKTADAIADLDWIADIDRDNKPDLMLITTYHFSYREAKLFLSSTAKEGELLREVGCFGASAD